MRVPVIALTDFQHGRLAFREGHPPTPGDGLLDEHTAADLERRGLIRVTGEPLQRPADPPDRTKEAPPLRTQEAPPRRTQEAPGKPVADGQGTPSASLPPAQVSPSKTPEPLKRGKGKRQQKGT